VSDAGPPGQRRRHPTHSSDADGIAAAMQVRQATRADVPTLLRLVRELADFEKLAPPERAAEERFARDLGHRFEAFVAEEDGDALGYAIVFETYSTFRAKPILYLEDLFVSPRARRRGVARALMERVTSEARSRGCVRVSWVVLDWNVEAQRFYEKLGAKRTPWFGYEIEI